MLLVGLGMLEVLQRLDIKQLRMLERIIPGSILVPLSTDSVNYIKHYDIISYRFGLCAVVFLGCGRKHHDSKSHFRPQPCFYGSWLQTHSDGQRYHFIHNIETLIIKLF